MGLAGSDLQRTFAAERTCPFTGKTAAPRSQRDFRNFGSADPLPAADLHTPDDELLRLQNTLLKLVRRSGEIHRYRDGATSRSGEHDNPDIPCGYTYLSQFAAHDMVHSTATHASISTASLLVADVAHTNLRSRAFVLDTLYGGGPEGAELAYQPAAVQGWPRELLRLGRVADARLPVIPGYGDAFKDRDLPRVDVSRAIGGERSGATDALIADSRNDDNAMLAQVVQVFHLFHNAIVARVAELKPFTPALAGPGLTLRRFGVCRRIAAAAFRRIVIRDVVATLVRPDVYRLYDAADPRPLVDAADARVPLEYAQGVARLGHAMVRPFYRFNRRSEPEGIRDSIRTNSTARPTVFPLEDVWVAEWSSFFRLPGRPEPQASRRIGPSYNDMMLFDTIFPNRYHAEGADPEPDSRHGGILLWDLIRCTMGGLRSVDSLAAAMPPAVLALSPLLADAAHRRAAIAAWLEASETVRFDASEIERLSRDPPLVFYLLFEAAMECDGKHLGTLGSVLCADTHFNLIASTRDLVEDAPEPALMVGFDQLLDATFDGAVPSSMAELILWVADRYGLERAEPTFL